MNNEKLITKRVEIVARLGTMGEQFTPIYKMEITPIVVHFTCDLPFHEDEPINDETIRLKARIALAFAIQVSDALEFNHIEMKGD